MLASEVHLSRHSSECRLEQLILGFCCGDSLIHSFAARAVIRIVACRAAK
jgi:hypothetical protein